MQFRRYAELGFREHLIHIFDSHPKQKRYSGFDTARLYANTHMSRAAFKQSSICTLVVRSLFINKVLGS